MTAHISNDGLGREESVAEHTEKTTFLCSKKGKRCGLSRLMAICGLFHDTGKNKQKFDEYIHADEKTRRKLRGTIAHASTGAKYIYDTYHNCEGNTRVMTEMIAYAIASHHGLFDCVDVEHKDIFSGKMDAVDDYEEAYGRAKQNYLDEYDQGRMFADASDEFDFVWNKIKDLYMKLKVQLPACGKEDAKERLSECRSFLFSFAGSVD